MIARHFSMRAASVILIVAMGVLGVVLSIASGEFYRELALDTEREHAGEQLRRELARMREGFDVRTRALAVHARAHAPFLQALDTGQPAALARELDGFHRYVNISSDTAVRVARLFLLDASLRTVAASELGEAAFPSVPCAELLSAAVAAAERNGSTQRICVTSDRSQVFSLAPVMVGRGGYLLLVGDLVTGVAEIEQFLSSPLRLRLPDGRVLYQSPEWPQLETLPPYVVASRPIPAFTSKPAMLELTLAKDIRVFEERLQGMRYLVIVGATTLMTLAALMALLALEYGTFKPLRHLGAQLQRLRRDARASTELLVVGGHADIGALTDGLNHLAIQLRESHTQVERLAFTDPLTDLPNRSQLYDRLRHEILAAQREGRQFALLTMDLDRFRDFNETFGHPVGDVLLTQVAQRLRTKLRDTDTVARLGGDEFAVILPAVDEKHAGMAARMLLQALRAPFKVEDHTFNIGASIGIALYPENGVDATVLMQRADVAMYAAKQTGAGFAFYSPTLDQNLPSRVTLLSDLRKAVEQEQFELYYQPIVDLAANKVVGIEALARWRHPRDGILLPDTFIPLLEQSGLIHALMPWVMSEALKCAHIMDLAGLSLSMSINLSMRDLQDPYIVDSVSELLQAHEVDPGKVVLEITESAVMSDPPRTLELLNGLARMGLRIAIDDFGTGYSSLAYLKKLPVTTLKIDKTFVAGMINDENDATIVRTSIELAHNLGLKVVAEGVESESALGKLKGLGCDLAQGHYVTRPLSRAELDDWLMQSSWSEAGVDQTAPGVRWLRP